jgi:hypothetical protein
MREFACVPMPSAIGAPATASGRPSAAALMRASPQSALASIQSRPVSGTSPAAPTKRGAIQSPQS